MKDNVVARRLGLDDFLEFFLGAFGESFGVGFVGVAFATSCGIVGIERSIFGEVSIFDDVVASVVESCDFFVSDFLWRLFDGWVTSFEVEESGVFDGWFLSELDECMMMGISVFVEFFGDNSIDAVIGFDFFEQEMEEFVVVEVGLRVGEEDIPETDAKWSWGHDDGRKL